MIQADEPMVLALELVKVPRSPDLQADARSVMVPSHGELYGTFDRGDIEIIDDEKWLNARARTDDEVSIAQ
jgi:hypothetical protein